MIAVQLCCRAAPFKKQTLITEFTQKKRDRGGQQMVFKQYDR